MIPGVVNDDLAATIRLLLCGPGGQEEDIEAIIDTGFNGFLTLSPAMASRLALLHLGQSRVLLASGQEEILDLYEVTLLWDGQWQTVEVDAADTDALVGMALLDGYNLSVQVVVGGHVVIEALP